MRNFAAIFITILSITVVKAQRSNQFYIDSLKHELTIAKEDTNRVNILTRLSNLYSDYSHADSGIAYAQQALDLAKKLNFEKGLYESEMSLGFDDRNQSRPRQSGGKFLSSGPRRQAGQRLMRAE